MEGQTEFLLSIAPEKLFDECRIKTIKTGSNRCVRSKEVTCPCHGQGNFKGLPACFHETSGSFQNGKGGMSFIEMAHLRLNTQSHEQSPASNAQEQFLLETQFGTAAIQLTGDPSVRRKVGRVIAIQQVQLDATDLDLPGAEPDRVARQSDLQP